MIWVFVVENKNIQPQLTDGLGYSQEQKYTCKNDYTVNLINESKLSVTQK
jgi:hypothetical protein